MRNLERHSNATHATLKVESQALLIWNSNLGPFKSVSDALDWSAGQPKAPRRNLSHLSKPLRRFSEIREPELFVENEQKQLNVLSRFLRFSDLCQRKRKIDGMRERERKNEIDCL